MLTSGDGDSRALAGPAPIIADPGPVHRIVTLHMNALGDLLFSLPALHALRQHFRRAHLSAVVRPGLAPLLEGSPLADVVILRPRGLAGKPALIAGLRAARFDLAVAFSRSGPTTTLARLTGAPVRVGFAHARLCGLLTHHVSRVNPPSLENNLRLVRALGCPTVGHDYRGFLPLTARAHESAEALLAEHGVSDPFLLAAPEASANRSVKEWPAAHWADALGRLGSRWPVVLVGSRPHPLLPRGSRVVDLRGRTDVATLAALCARARLCLGVDSGVLHLASASGTPVVGIYGPTDWRVTGPRGGTPHRIVRQELACSPCLRSRCRWRGDDERRCLTQLSPGAVVEAARELLES